MNRNLKPKRAVIALFLLIGTTAIAFAHSGATGIVKQRMDMMGMIGDSMKIIGSMIKGQVSFDANSAKEAAMTIVGHAEEIPELFPEGTTDKPSEALPAIWENWDEFVKITEQMKADAQILADAAAMASEASEIRAQFGAVGKSCGSCHEQFRLKK